jgi:hypothetical protein
MKRKKWQEMRFMETTRPSTKKHCRYVVSSIIPTRVIRQEVLGRPFQFVV